MANSIASEFSVIVGRIIPKRDLAFLQVCVNLLTVDGEQWPDQGDPLAECSRMWHSGKPPEAGSSQNVVQYGFCLVLLVVCGNDP